ncbi:MAG: 30S ribosomal protein S8 [Anaerohalosphaeraceae bacterium]|nr:30S ribosomal protein S8 [Anaerohalosphaeraceae bacterium]
MHSDPIADMLTRIRNASATGHPKVMVRASKICQGIADVLRSQGYIVGYDKIDDSTGQGLLNVELKYAIDGRSAITEIKRRSKTGLRIYSSVDSLPTVMNGMGIAVVSTSKGIMTDNDCRKANVGGEIICTVC